VQNGQWVRPTPANGGSVNSPGVFSGQAPVGANGQLLPGWTVSGNRYYNTQTGIFSNKDGTIQARTGNEWGDGMLRASIQSLNLTYYDTNKVLTTAVDNGGGGFNIVPYNPAWGSQDNYSFITYEGAQQVLAWLNANGITGGQIVTSAVYNRNAPEYLIHFSNGASLNAGLVGQAIMREGYGAVDNLQAEASRPGSDRVGVNVQVATGTARDLYAPSGGSNAPVTSGSTIIQNSVATNANGQVPTALNNATVQVGQNLSTSATTTVIISNILATNPQGQNAGSRLGPNYKIEIGGQGLNAYNKFELVINNQTVSITSAVISENKITLTVPSNIPGEFSNAPTRIKLSSSNANVTQGLMGPVFFYTGLGGSTTTTTGTTTNTGGTTTNVEEEEDDLDIEEEEETDAESFWNNLNRTSSGSGSGGTSGGTRTGSGTGSTTTTTSSGTTGSSAAATAAAAAAARARANSSTTSTSTTTAGTRTTTNSSNNSVNNFTRTGTTTTTTTTTTNQNNLNLDEEEEEEELEDDAQNFWDSLNSGGTGGGATGSGGALSGSTNSGSGGSTGSSGSSSNAGATGSATGSTGSGTQTTTNSAQNQTITQLTTQIGQLENRIATLTNQLNAPNQASADLQSARNEITGLRQQINNLTNSIAQLQANPVRVFDSGITLQSGLQFPQGLQMPAGYPASGGAQSAEAYWNNLNQGQGQVQSAKTAKGSYTVKKGDTLWKIAKKYYGDGAKWRKILEANPDCLARRGDTKTLKVGFSLVIPE
jgi:LysM repeat protein